MEQLVSKAVEAGLNFTWSVWKYQTHFRMVWLNSKLIILRSSVTKWQDRGVAGASVTKGAALAL